VNPLWLRCFAGILDREFLRFLRQRARFFASLVRPLVWLIIFATGFHSVLGLSRIPPYETYVLYEEYIVPGLVGLILLFNGMQTALSMVFDREMGSMKVLLVSPLPRWYLLTCRLLAGVIVAVPQVYAFLACAWLWGVRPPAAGYLYVAPAIVVAGLMLGAIGLLVSSVVEQLENFAGVMNFVILPMFFASTALYRWIAAAGTTACPNVVVPSRSSSLDRDWPGNQTVSSPRRLSSDKLGRSKRPRRRSRPTHAGGN
jgi:ABC-2 type transport system permease protein